VLDGPDKEKTALRRIVSATRCSVDGLVAAARHEAAFRQELVAVALLAPLALWIGRTGLERAALIATLLLVLIVELLNSAIEATVDRISLERHPLAKRAKDIGSAAVMLALVCASLTWLLILVR
jgi:diacylglycerol kinase (ATP)